MGQFLLGLALVANGIYGIVLLRRSMPKNWLRLLVTVLMVTVFEITMIWALVYVPWTVWRHRRAVPIA